MMNLNNENILNIDELKKIYNFVTENTINLDKILICPKRIKEQ